MKITKSRIDDEPELSTAQVARHFNFSVATINGWRLEGMPAIRYNSRLFRYKLSKVEKWLEARGKKAAA
jgi:hypothetical protein